MPVPEERVIKEEFTEEFLREFAEVEGDKALETLEKVASRIEESYEAVAWVNGKYRSRHVYAIVIIPKRTADREQIQLGIQSVYHWIDKMRENNAVTQ